MSLLALFLQWIALLSAKMTCLLTAPTKPFPRTNPLTYLTFFLPSFLSLIAQDLQLLDKLIFLPDQPFSQMEDDYMLMLGLTHITALPKIPNVIAFSCWKHWERICFSVVPVLVFQGNMKFCVASMS